MTLITLEPDMNIEPGHQWLVIDNDVAGYCLATLLLNSEMELARSDGDRLFIAHSQDVDRRILTLIDELAYVRFSAPGLVQMTMTETQEVQG